MPSAYGYNRLNSKFRLKYALDRVFACALIPLVLPVFLMVAYYIKLGGWLWPKDSGSIFYTEPRISGGKLFNIIKFRTVSMEMIEQIRKQSQSRSITGSCHVTRAGRLILKLYLDELPQLFNIAKGDISFVGPRPHIISHHEMDIKSRLVYRNIIKAGLLGIPQACKRRPEYAAMLEKMMLKHRPYGRVINNLDKLYVNKCVRKSVLGIIFFDSYIIIQGIIVVLLAEGK